MEKASGKTIGETTRAVLMLKDICKCLNTYTQIAARTICKITARLKFCAKLWKVFKLKKLE